ncbi:MAG: hypothetical protein P8X65_12960 [Syntrophobacterales bacterium]|jgi:hypothetical protein
MRTTAVLVILLLTLGLSLGVAPALAGENAVIQPLPSACQPVSDVELSQMRGKLLAVGTVGTDGTDGCFNSFLCNAVRSFWVNKVPAKFKQSCLGQKLKSYYRCICQPNMGPTPSQ